jgi:hypothetical protein
VKTARFATIVESCGKPETHLLLTQPAKDRTLQSAVKAGRVMTVFQQNVGTKSDRGKVGFEPGAGRQFLLFPKSLKRFSGTSVVGIKYELMTDPPIPKSQRATLKPPKKPKAPRKAKARGKPRAPGKPKTTRKAAATGKAKTPKTVKARRRRARERPKTPPAPSKVVAFKREDEKPENEEVSEIKSQVRRALSALEDGKQVAAFNLLKRVVGE